MTFDMHAILESKRLYRKQLSELPYAEKLRLLDRLRERSVILGASRAAGLRKNSESTGSQLPDCGTLTRDSTAE